MSIPVGSLLIDALTGDTVLVDPDGDHAGFLVERIDILGTGVPQYLHYQVFFARMSYDAVLTVSRLDAGDIVAGGSNYPSITFHIVVDADGIFVKWECDQDSSIYINPCNISMSGYDPPIINYVKFPLVIPGNTPSSEQMPAEAVTVDAISYGQYKWYYGEGATYKYQIAGNRVSPWVGWQSNRGGGYGEGAYFLFSKGVPAPTTDGGKNFAFTNSGFSTKTFHLVTGSTSTYRWPTRNVALSEYGFNGGMYSATGTITGAEKLVSGSWVSCTLGLTIIPDYIAYPTLDYRIPPCNWKCEILDTSVIKTLVCPTRERFPTHFTDGSYVF